ncbi:far upstream element-binding 2 [Cordyceps militaris]|uniref:Far upstream element-binding 2 n=1 Tax=Cordyceps militaris TaxID=73501 RepID=A0A2H4SEX9_CORMI|nr:far upstream element-binding 2 [Cordyceps militaris]
MAEPQPDIQSILAALGEKLSMRPSARPHADCDFFSLVPASQRPAGATPTQTPSAAPGQSYAPPPGAAQAGYGAPAQQGMPAPAASGSVDLSAIRPVNSGTVSFDDVLSKARAFAAAKGVASYDQPLVYGAESRDADQPYGRPRSRSPQRDHQNDRRGGHGREYGRERSWSPPRERHSPRSGRGRDRSPLRSGGGGDENSETIQIESSLVGLIIGRNGENLRRIESESSCRVQFLSPTDGGPFRQCRITGPAPRRSEVKDAINRIIEDSGMGALNRAEEKPTVQGAATVLRDGEDHMQIMVPDRTVGLIIGRGGETIRDLQERSGCHINIVHESKSVNGLRPVNLIGTPVATARAKDFILEIVDSDSRADAQGGPPGGPKPPPMPRGGGGGGGGGQSRDHNQHSNPYDGPGKVTDAIYVPSDAVGMIIGKGGETIREIQSQAECKINVAQSSGPGEVQREISLVGAPASIERAKQLIDEKVEAMKQKNAGGGGRGGRDRHDGGGRGGHDVGGRGGHHERGQGDRGGNNYAQASTTNAPQQGASGDAADPYAQYGGYQNYVNLWYQSLMYQQQQQGGGDGTPPAGAPPK